MSVQHLRTVRADLGQFVRRWSVVFVWVWCAALLSALLYRVVERWDIENSFTAGLVGLVVWIIPSLLMLFSSLTAFRLFLAQDEDGERPSRTMVLAGASTVLLGIFVIYGLPHVLMQYAGETVRATVVEQVTDQRDGGLGSGPPTTCRLQRPDGSLIPLPLHGCLEPEGATLVVREGPWGMFDPVPVTAQNRSAVFLWLSANTAAVLAVTLGVLTARGIRSRRWSAIGGWPAYGP